MPADDLKQRVIAAHREHGFALVYGDAARGRTPNGSGYVDISSPLPGREDADPSFSFNARGDGEWKDFGNGDSGDLFTFAKRAHGLEFRAALLWLADLAGVQIDEAERKKLSAPARAKGKGSRSPVVAVYPYRNERGWVVHEKARRADKSFMWWHEPGRRQGRFAAPGAIPSGMESRIIPYRLPELVRVKAGAAVLVVEGEKDADTAVERLELPATTAPDGAGSWRKIDEKTRHEALRGRHVFVVPDNDDQGDRHAADVAADLVDVAASVRIVRLPGLEAKGDLTDWVDAGGTRAAFIELAEAVPPLSRDDAAAAKVEADDDQRAPSRRTFGAEEFVDLAVAERFETWVGGDLLYAEERSTWIRWNGTRWRPVPVAIVGRLYSAFVHHEIARLQRIEENAQTSDVRDAAAAAVEKAKAVLPTRAKRDNVLSILRYAVTTSLADFDQDRWAFVAQNAIVDLRTGEAREATREDRFLTGSETPWDPDAKCPRWLRFLDEVFQSDAKMIDYVRRALGYTITGDISIRAIHLCYGGGANGKSVFLDVIRSVLGEYSGKPDADVFMHGTPSSARQNGMAQIEGKRFVWIAEIGEGRRINEAMIKDLTGGEPVNARWLYSDPHTFEPQAKLWMGTNHLPNVRESDSAIWKRMRPIPFTRTFSDSEQDPRLRDALLGERSGILRWVVEGCLEWQREGLRPPRPVIEAINLYREEEDPVVEFFRDACYAGGPGVETQARKLYKAYAAWWKENRGRHPPNHKAFGMHLGEHNLTKVKRGGKVWWQGVGLRFPDDESQDHGQDHRQDHQAEHERWSWQNPRLWGCEIDDVSLEQDHQDHAGPSESRWSCDGNDEDGGTYPTHQDHRTIIPSKKSSRGEEGKRAPSRADEGSSHRPMGKGLDEGPDGPDGPAPSESTLDLSLEELLG